MTRRNLFGIFFAAPLVKVFPQVLLNVGDTIKIVPYASSTSSAKLANLTTVFYKKKGLERLQKMFVFSDLNSKFVAPYDCEITKIEPYQSTFDFYSDYESVDEDEEDPDY